ncbi:MAG: acyl-CoA dehydrogenase family protein [Egibacteraceae bacterium]
MESIVDIALVLSEACRSAVDRAVDRLAADTVKDGRVDLELLDREQVFAYDLASIAGRVVAAEILLDSYAGRGELEAMLTAAFVGDVAADLEWRTAGRAEAWGGPPPLGSGDLAAAFSTARSPELLEKIARRALVNPDLPRQLSDELRMVRETFGGFADTRVEPVAERVHRDDADIPEDIIRELGEMGCFGLSIPDAYGGFAEGESADHFMSMVVVTEELSRGSLGVAGSLITRPEILSKALVKGGTDEQRQRWLPEIASGALMCGVAVTEPDYGSDVANVKVTARKDGGAYVVNGVKTWCTFGGRADLLMLLARTDPDRSKRHRGLSLFVVEKPPFPGHSWEHEDGRGGRMQARAIGTLGYRGMHSFEIAFENFHVPVENLVGGEGGRGQGFYLQMDAFANGRLQTAARALGVMQAAFERAVAYANERQVFGVPLGTYQLTRAKLARMAALIVASREFSYRCAALLGTGSGQLEASMVKSMSCLAAEWLTREAMQIHGGYGYAEEYAVSRYFVDARVLSIFEGADETLALRVIIRRLLEEAAP